MWKDIEVPEKQLVSSHGCALKHMHTKTNGWNCDKIKGLKKCYSGLTGFYQSTGIHVWSCEVHDYDMCVKCMKVELLYARFKERDD